MRFANNSRMAALSPKMRSKVGAIVARSRGVSLTSKTMNGRSDMRQTSDWSALRVKLSSLPSI
ncbi:MAG: hypothetical protein WBS22_06585 [Methylocystis sp.]